MDWSQLLTEGAKVLASGGVGGFIASLVTNRINHKAAAGLAELDRKSRAQISDRDRTYNDARTAFLEAITLLNRLAETVRMAKAQDPFEDYADPDTVNGIKAKLEVFVSPEAAETFREAAFRYYRSWLAYRDSRQFQHIDPALDEWNRLRGRETSDTPAGIAKMAKRDRWEADSKESYSKAETGLKHLTEMARNQLREVDS